MIWGKGRGEHEWFAWRPVKLENGKWAWLELVYRRPWYIGWVYNKQSIYKEVRNESL